MVVPRLGGTKKMMAIEEGCKIFEGKMGMIVSPLLISKSEDVKRYRMPRSIGRGVIRIVASERGGATLDAGKAFVITDPNGNELRAFHLPENPEPLGYHARFCRTKDLFEIMAQWGQYGSTLAVNRLSKKDQNDDVIVLSRTRELELNWRQGFQDHDLELEGRFKCLMAAARAAVEKSQCQLCKCGHFVVNNTTSRTKKTS